jgi:ketosteroid isomerase-like protein
VLDPPPPGSSRSAVVTALELVGAEGNRRGYHAELRTETGRRGVPVVVGREHALVVLSQDADGRWRVVAESPDSGGDLPIGED